MQGKRGTISGRSFYLILCDGRTDPVPLKPIWKFQDCLSSCTAAFNVILTTNDLDKTDFFLLNLCCMCMKAKKSVDHLLLHCDVASDNWSLLLDIFGVSWVMQATVLELLDCLGQGRCWRRVKRAWNVGPRCPRWGFGGCEM